MPLPCVAGIEREGEGKLGARFSHAPEIPFPSPLPHFRTPATQAKISPRFKP